MSNKSELTSFVEIYTITMTLIALTLQSQNNTNEPPQSSIKALTHQIITALPTNTYGQAVLTKEDYLNHLANILYAIHSQIPTQPEDNQIAEQPNTHLQTTNGETSATQIQTVDGLMDPKQVTIRKAWCYCIILWVCLLSILILHYGIFYESDIAEANKVEGKDLTQTSWFSPLFCFCMFYACYTFEWLGSETFQCLKHVRNAEYVMNKINRLQRRKPNILWNIECYHVVKSGGPSPATRKTKRVVTHRAKKTYEYASWKDVSAGIGSLEQFALVQLKLSTSFTCGNGDTMKDFEAAKRKFKKDNDKDKRQTFSERMDLREEYDAYMLVETGPGGKSKWVDSWIYAMFSCFLCSACYREWLMKRTVSKQYTVQKEIYI